MNEHDGKSHKIISKNDYILFSNLLASKTKMCIRTYQRHEFTDLLWSSNKKASASTC